MKSKANLPTPKAKPPSQKVGESGISSPPQKPKVRQRSLLWLFAAAVVLFLASLPWQIHQWEQTRRLHDETALQETRLKEIKEQQTQARSAQKELLHEDNTDLNTRLDAARVLLTRGDSIGAGKLLQSVEASVDISVKTGSQGDTNEAKRKSLPLIKALAGLYQEAGWVDRALVNAQRAVQIAPDDVEALLHLAVIEAQIGWQQECQRNADTALKLAPESAEPHLTLALLKDQIGSFNAAERELRIADRIRPHDEHIAFLLFQNQMRQHLYEPALRIAQTSVKEHPSSPDWHNAVAQSLIEQGLVKGEEGGKATLKEGMEAVRRYQSLAPANTDAHYWLGKALLGLGDETAAVREWKTAYAAQPKDASLAISLGRLLVRHGEPEMGAKLLDSGNALRHEADEYNRLLGTAGMNRQKTEKHRELARWCQKRGRTSFAILEWEQVLQLLPNDTEAKAGRARCVLARLEPGSAPH